MGLLGDIRNKASSVGSFLSSTGKGALKKIGEGAKSVKKLGGDIDAATGGAAGALWEASKSVPVVGAVTRNVGKGLDMAEKYSDLGVKAIELGEKAGKVRSVKDAGGIYKEAKGLYKSGRK